MEPVCEYVNIRKKDEIAMREKLDIPEQLLRTTLQDQYDLTPATLEFLPVGLDYHAGVYRVVSQQGNAYLLKVTSRPLYEPRYQVPRYLKNQGITAVVAPLPTRNGGLWTTFANWTAIVYPFIAGDSSLMGMTDEHWRKLGSIFKQIHQAAVPAEGFESLRKETFDVTAYARWVQTFEAQHLHAQGGSAPQRALRADWLAYQDKIHTAVRSLEKLAGVLQKRSGPYVFCHADLHPANLIRDSHGSVFVIDWDDVMLAPKERDFIFIRDSEADPFWEGYGHSQIDWGALTYYRWERIVQDVIACADDLFFKNDLSEETRADIAGLFHKVLLDTNSILMSVYAAAAHLPTDLTV